MTRLEKILFQLTIFLIPTNLFLKWILPESYIRGILVDYLIPKLYVSDITILLLILIWFAKSLPKLKKTAFIPTINQGIIGLLLYIFLLRGFFTSAPIASTWYFLKIIEYVLFFFWLKAHKNLVIQNLQYSLLWTLLFQSAVGLYQFISQHSVLSYYFLGETTLTHSANISKIDLTNLPFTQELGLLIAPYGTTPHPNVLAGFICTGLILLYCITRGEETWTLYQKILYRLTFIASLIVLLATASAAAWIIGLIIMSIIGLASSFSKHAWKLPIGILFTLVSALYINKYHLLEFAVDNYSVQRRAQLNNISLNMWQEHPLMGVGLNQFTVKLSEYGTLSSYTSFLQPAHNIYLLWIAETGALGLIFLIPLIGNFIVKNTNNNQGFLSFLPALTILGIGLFDHYPLTLQTGQLITILCMFFMFETTKNQKLPQEKTR